MASFRLLRIFNQEGFRGYAGTKSRIGRNSRPFFTGDNLFERLIRELAVERALPVKEITEAFEFFAATRRYLRRPVMADLCSGHGLVGILFGACERKTEKILLLDRRRPQNFDAVWRATLRVAPWVEDKLEYVEGDLARGRERIPEGSAIVAVHACGKLTDTCLEIAVERKGPVAVMPCCRDHSLGQGPPAVAEALGGDLAYDIARTYRMEAAGYRVRWREIPEEITVMNRVLIAVRRPVQDVAGSI